MKKAEGRSSTPPSPRSTANFAQRIASIETPAEFGESSTDRRSSRFIGTSPKSFPSMRKKTHLVVVLPSHVVAGADVDVLVGQTLACHGLNSLGLGALLRIQSASVQHVQKIGVAAGVELIGPLEFHPAFAKEVRQHSVGNGRAELRFDVISNHGDSRAFELCRESLVASDEHRDAIHDGDPGFQGAPSVEASGLFRAHGQVVHQDLRRYPPISQCMRPTASSALFSE
jgi:hypothetical protein